MNENLSRRHFLETAILAAPALMFGLPSLVPAAGQVGKNEGRMVCRWLSESGNLFLVVGRDLSLDEWGTRAAAVSGVLFQSSPTAYPQTWTFRVGHLHHVIQANDLTEAMRLAEEHLVLSLRAMLVEAERLAFRS